jgi:lipoate-protein ligase A
LKHQTVFQHLEQFDLSYGRHYTFLLVLNPSLFITLLLQSQIPCAGNLSGWCAIEYNMPMNIWRLLIHPPARGAWNMAVDEAILEHIGSGDALPTLRLYAWDPACLSLGHAQPFADVDSARVHDRGWEVVRRATGGRAILHTDELTYSVTGSLEESVLAGGVLESYNRLSQALLLALQKLRLPVEIKEDRTSDNGVPNPVCFEVPSTYEITVGGKKLIGSAQARKKEGVLQHGSLPLTGDLTRICQALVFENASARQEASERLLRRATTVESALGRVVHWDTAAAAFSEAFQSQLGLCLEEGKLSPSEANRAEQLVEEKYAHPSWTERV